MNNQSERCYKCNKRLKLTDLKCKCNNYYCNLHKYPDKHDCSFNYLENQQNILKYKNPKIIPDKIRNY